MASRFEAASRLQRSGRLPWLWLKLGKSVRPADVHWRKRLKRSLKTLQYKGVLTAAESRLWDQASHPHVLHFHCDYLKKVGVVVDRLLGGVGNFTALHFRSVEFDKRQPLSSQAVIECLLAKRQNFGIANRSPIFVATDNPNWFERETFVSAGLNLVFWDDVLNLQLFPRSKHDAIVEQLLCGFAGLFVGTGGSTFSTQISQFRERTLKQPSALLPGTEFIDP